MQILRKWVFEEWVSTQEHIERLSNPENEIDPIEVANLVIKFAVDYILTWTNRSFSVEKLNQEEVNFIIDESISTIIKNSKKAIDKIITMQVSISPEISNFTQKVLYQLKMLLDFSKTSALVLEIISRQIPYNSNWYYWLDLWTWSGILLLAQYIQARRNWFTYDEIKNIWIEENTTAVNVWNKLAEKLWFWEIRKWDTTDDDIIKWLWLPYLSFVSNENLPNSSDELSKEPFIENILALEKAWFSLSESELFPKVFYSKYHEKTNIKDDQSFQNFLKLYWNDYLIIKVPYIEIWWKKQHLADIWTEFEEYFTQKFLDNTPRRWC